MTFREFLEAYLEPDNKFLLTIGRKANSYHKGDDEDALDSPGPISVRYDKKLFNDIESGLEAFREAIFQVKQELESQRINLNGIKHVSLTFTGEGGKPVDIAWWNNGSSGFRQVQFGNYLKDRPDIKQSLMFPTMHVPNSLKDYDLWRNKMLKASQEKTLVQKAL